MCTKQSRFGIHSYWWIWDCALSTGKLPRRLAQEQCGQVNWPCPKLPEVSKGHKTPTQLQQISVSLSVSDVTVCDIKINLDIPQQSVYVNLKRTETTWSVKEEQFAALEPQHEKTCLTHCHVRTKSERLICTYSVPLLFAVSIITEDGVYTHQASELLVRLTKLVFLAYLRRFFPPFSLV